MGLSICGCGLHCLCMNSTSLSSHLLYFPAWNKPFQPPRPLPLTGPNMPHCFQRVTVQRMGVGEVYSLPDLARLLWACAALGVQPRPGLINSFAGQ